MFVILRLISLVLIVLALMLLGADAVTSLENGGKITVRSLDEVWALFNKPAMQAFHGWANAHLPHVLVSATNAVFALPGWAATGVPGIILAFLFGRRGRTA